MLLDDADAEGLHQALDILPPSRKVTPPPLLAGVRCIHAHASTPQYIHHHHVPQHLNTFIIIITKLVTRHSRLPQGCCIFITSNTLDEARVLQELVASGDNCSPPNFVLHEVKVRVGVTCDTCV